MRAFGIIVNIILKCKIDRSFWTILWYDSLMDLLPAAIEAERALVQKNVALSTIKQTAQAQAQIATILTDAVLSISASNRGNLLNTSA